MNQTTIKESCVLTGGVGLHSGKKAAIYFYPAPANHGIQFFRSDKNITIPATYQHAESSALCTTITKNGIKITTIEHVMSVCNGLGLDNLLIEITEEEVPILDGSGLFFYQKLSQVGVKILDEPKKVIRITDTVSFNQDNIAIYVTPSNQPVFTFSIDYEHQQIGQQEYTFQLNETNYKDQIVQAKTFCLEKDIQKMQDMGLIKGGSKESAIILNENGDVDNMEVMTWLNEPNLHKILDQVGDFYMANNMRIIGNTYSHKSGHAANLAFITYLMDECQDNYVIEEDI